LPVLPEISMVVKGKKGPKGCPAKGIPAGQNRKKKEPKLWICKKRKKNPNWKRISREKEALYTQIYPQVVYNVNKTGSFFQSIFMIANPWGVSNKGEKEVFPVSLWINRPMFP